MELCGFAYKDMQPDMPNVITKSVDNKKTKVQYYLRKSQNTLNITFRGSDEPKDWAYDFSIWKKVLPYGNKNSKIRVHAGFITAYKDTFVRDTIHKYIADDIHNIVVCGHSYGAALAILCAVDIEYNFPHKALGVYAFGCPRVGNKAFAKSYNKRVFQTIRRENGSDIFTKLPPRFLGYHHVGSKVSIGKKQKPFSFQQHKAHNYFGELLTYGYFK